MDKEEFAELVEELIELKIQQASLVCSLGTAEELRDKIQRVKDQISEISKRNS